MPFSPKPHPSFFSAPGRRRKSLATPEVEQSETLSSPTHPTYPSGMQPSASTSWINPFAPSHPLPRASVDEESLYQPPSSGSPPSSRRPSAATIISTLLHGVTGRRASQDGGSAGGVEYNSSEDSSSGSNTQPQSAGHGRRPSALFKAWKNRRGSNSAQHTASPAPTGGRRKSSALTRVLPAPLAKGAAAGVGRVDEHSVSSPRTGSTDDTRRRSLSIICRGERDSDDEFDLHTTPRHSDAIHSTETSGVTAAMAIRDTWLYGPHQWGQDGRKGSVSTFGTRTSYLHHLPRKSFSGTSAAVGLDVEEQHIRMKDLRAKSGRGGGDGESVVSLSLTEEIALYTKDVGRRSANSSTSTGQSSRYSPPRGTNWGGEGGSGMVWNMPNWNGAASKLPDLSPGPAMMIADPFAGARPLSQEVSGVGSAGMQRVESGSLDPVLSPIPASSPSLEVETAAGEAGGLQWNTTSPFTPNALSSHRPSVVQEEHSPTAPVFPPTSPVSPIAEEVRRRATTYYDASSLLPVVDELPTSPSHAEFTIPRSPRSPRSPKSPRSFGHSEPSYALRRRESYSLPRPPPGYQPSGSTGEAREDDEMPTPRLVSMDFSSCSPMSSNFAPETPSNIAASFPEVYADEFRDADETVMPQEREEEKVDEGDDLHEQFCSVLLLDLGNGTAIPLSASPGLETRLDPFSLLAH